MGGRMLESFRSEFFFQIDFRKCFGFRAAYFVQLDYLCTSLIQYQHVVFFYT